ncbi:hypothetical protein BD780_001364 [Clostridium tetanomorphum]|uniref:DUF4163 domain-containing protein n=1 Tax=Clostridium tetanomorphum TaxID=1553 RepID=A0A923E7V6_CLOTT|nr:DUF4163 domain-containing protein [Clostridium tetanomorphum]KAJ53916.1 hypothetical protein CTM_00090 [Clostridium tetanomorphum DSM 665]MBC2398100.1 DUF4163 domain-containing protein [Clostridium tetanomorphum]MBP1864669.1 hypothetical protein [Clostridium tetanomorphum]NRS84139.1 hypothetical protein [Clostridium tetanomorphum]NRZ97352.1 hypothetical protein [Clostridium tetanomorphum]
MKRLFYLALAASLTLSNISTVCAKGVNLDPSIKKIIVQSKESNLNSVNIITNTIKSKNSHSEIDIKYPQVIDLKDKQLETKINTIIKNTVTDFKNETEKIAENLEKDGLSTHPYIINVDYKIHYNKNNLLSITLSNYSYTGGAHGTTDNVSFNIDTKTGEEASLKDMFSSNEDYKKIINKFIREEIEKNPENYFQDATAFKDILPDQPFYIEDNNIVVYFGLYEIAPYSSGIQEFKIPFSNFNYGVKTNLNLKKDRVKVSSKIINQFEEGYIGNLIIPVVKEIKNSNIQTAINSRLEKDALVFNDKLKKDGMEFVKESQRLGIKPINYFGGTNYTVYQDNSNILSLTVLYNQYTGGAHGMYTKQAYNINLTTGKDIKLKDVFKPNVNYKDIINKEINKQIAIKNKVTNASQISDFTGINDKTNFYINNGTIVIYFQPYDIAPYALGIQEFKISLDSFKTMVQPQFLIK